MRNLTAKVSQNREIRLLWQIWLLYHFVAARSPTGANSVIPKTFVQALGYSKVYGFVPTHVLIRNFHR